MSNRKWNRQCSSITSGYTPTISGTTSNNESDSNADTCCLGSNFTILSYTNRTADIYPYNDSYEPVRQVPIVSGATKYDHPNGQSYILIINEVLYYGRKMDHSLINPNQLRHNGIGFKLIHMIIHMN